LRTLTKAAVFTVGLMIAGAAQAQEMRVALDQSRAIELNQPISGVVIGNPGVAGVSVQNDRLLFVTGRSYGQTNVIVVGANGKPILERRITVVPDESNVVMVTRGAATARMECTPLCRRRPDISDDPDAFSKVNEQITQRAGAARAE
jgi:Flp pilus assembly secretin CpaC